MNAKEKEIIKEVIHAMNTHYAILISHQAAIGNSTIPKGFMDDVVEGMNISLDKLEQLVK